MERVDYDNLQKLSDKLDPKLRQRIGVDRFLVNTPEDPEVEIGVINSILAIIRKAVANKLPLCIIGDLAQELMKIRSQIKETWQILKK